MWYFLALLVFYLCFTRVSEIVLDADAADLTKVRPLAGWWKHSESRRMNLLGTIQSTGCALLAMVNGCCRAVDFYRCVNQFTLIGSAGSGTLLLRIFSP